MMEYLSFLRIVSYIIIILTSFFMMKLRCKKYIHLANIIMAGVLMVNVILVCVDKNASNDAVAFALINVGVFVWAILHFVEFISNKEC